VFLVAPALFLAACSSSSNNSQSQSQTSSPAAGSSTGPATSGGSATASGSASGTGSASSSGSAAGTSAPATTDTEQAKNGGDLTIVGYQEMTTLDKDLAGTSNDALRVLENVLDRLYVLDGSAKPVPSLATGYTLSDDKLTWTFPLRTDAQFSDGTPVTAKDVKFSLDLAAKGDLMGSLYSKITSVTATDDHTVVIKTSTPEPVMLQLLTLETSGIIKDNYGGATKDAYYAKPMGSGPWMLDSVTQGVGVKLVPNPHWWGPKGHLNSITFNTVGDPNTRLIQLRSGQGQLIETPLFSQLDSINTGTTEVATFPSTEVDFLTMNTTKAPFDDVHFRTALSLAIDRKSIIEAGLRGHGTVATTWMSPSVLNNYIPAAGTTYDVNAAKAELAKSKYATYSQPIKLQYSKSAPSGWAEAAQVIQANLKSIGINLEISTADTNTLQAGVKNKTYDLGFGLLTYDIPDPGELVGYYFATNGYNSFVDTSSTQAMDKTAGAEFDPAARITAYQKVADNIVNVDASTPGLYSVPYFWGQSKQLHGLNVILTGQFNFNDLWLG
jgi:peptide/nickel transport system substrate-binding protein